MDKEFIEIYAKEEKELTTLVQEWINENIEIIISRCTNKEV